MSRLFAIVSCATLFWLLTVAAIGQSEEQGGMVKTADGILIVWNEPGNYFTIEIKGKQIVPAEQPMMFQVDGKFLQVVTTAKKLFLKEPNSKSSDERAILTAHRDWERDYIAGVLKHELKVESDWVKLPSGQEAHSWSYAMPKVATGQAAVKQLYLTVVKRDHILVVNTALLTGDSEKEGKDFLLSTLLTLKSTDKPLSLQKASEQVTKTKPD